MRVVHGVDGTLRSTEREQAARAYKTPVRGSEGMRRCLRLLQLRLLFDARLCSTGCVVILHRNQARRYVCVCVCVCL
jgi:hypothetical protein